MRHFSLTYTFAKTIHLLPSCQSACQVQSSKKKRQFILPVSGLGSMEEEGSQSKWRTSKPESLLKLQCQNGWNKDPQRKLKERNFKQE